MKRRGRPTRRGFSGTAGFTLLELLATMAILALVIGMAAPLLRGPPPGLQLQASAQRLCAAARVTRARAMASNAETALALDLARKSYRSPALAETFLPRGTLMELKIADMERHGAQQGDIMFFPSGASSGGEITLTLGGRRATIDVNWLTGAARCVVN